MQTPTTQCLTTTAAIQVKRASPTVRRAGQVVGSILPDLIAFMCRFLSASNELVDVHFIDGIPMDRNLYDTCLFHGRFLSHLHHGGLSTPVPIF